MLFAACQRTVPSTTGGHAGAARDRVDPLTALLGADHRRTVKAPPTEDASADRAGGVDAPSIERIDVSSTPDRGEVVISLSRPASYRVDDEAADGEDGDPRLFVDLDGVALADGGDFDARADGVVTRVRAEPIVTGARVQIEVDGSAWRRVVALPDPDRVVVELERHPRPASSHDPRAGAMPAPRTISRIVLDPGHGGSDHGARGSDGLEEKDVALDIARRAAAGFRMRGIAVMSTRDDDRFVSLQTRAAAADDFGADLFVSIHCNASESRAPRGVEAYVLDTNRDEIAARVAARENAAFPSAGGEVAAILGGLRIAGDSWRSRRLAELLLQASTSAIRAKYGDVVDGGVHTAGFYVLVGARVPAVLFETSYISNAIEGHRLGDPGYRQILADAIVNGVRAYAEGR